MAKEYKLKHSGKQIDDLLDKVKDTDSTYNPESDNPQSGKAVAEAIGRTITIDNFEYLTSTNILDTVSAKNNGYRVTNDPPYFAYSGAAIVAEPICVTGYSQITLRSNASSVGNRWVAFTTDTSRTQESVISVVAGLGNNKTGETKVVTLDVPDGANYVYITLRVAEETSDGYLNDTVAFGLYPTTEKYSKEKFISSICGIPVKGISQYDFEYSSATNNILDTSIVSNKGYRITSDSPYFVSSKTAVVSEPIFVGGHSQITLRSYAHAPSTRWVAFTTDTSRATESVVSVVSGLGGGTEGVTKVVTLDIPQRAKYVYISLRVEGTEGTTYLNDTVAFGKLPTKDKYVKDNSVSSICGVPIKGADAEKNTDTVVEYENIRVNQKFIPYSIGTPKSEVSFDNAYDRANILFFTDSHIDSPASVSKKSIENVKNTIDFANNALFNLSAVIHGGDIITTTGVIAKNTAKSLANQFFDELKTSTCPVVFSKGNHDTNDWFNTPSNTFDDLDWSGMWYDYAETNYGIVRQTKASGNKSTWHYYDIEEHKIRIIGVDMQDTDKTITDANGNVKYYGGKAWYISNEQMNWIVNTALNFGDKAEKDWGVIIVLHQETIERATADENIESATNKLLKVCEAFNTQSQYTNTYLSSENPFYLSINADFTKYANETNKPHIICWLLGHEHVDKNDVKNGINRIWLANGSATTSSSDARVARICGTTTQNCFDLISIDTSERKIRCVRYGAGVNCYGNGGDRFLLDGLSY